MPQNLEIILGTTSIFWRPSTSDSLDKHTCEYEQKDL